MSAILSCEPALAQTEPLTPTGNSQAEAPNDAVASNADSASSNDIIVTALRRSQRLSEVPVAITTASALQLNQAGVTNLRDLNVVTPGLRVSGLGANAQPSIRGVHSDQVDPGNDANVSLYVDGVYQANQIANAIDLPDVDRIEVLKGPQGTLFGRNATGGAIRIFTREPTFQPTATVDVGYGRFNDAHIKGFVSGPIVGDTIAASISGGYERADSYLTDVTTGKKGPGLRSTNIRGKVLIKPSSDLSITLSGVYVDRSTGMATAYQPLTGNSIGRLFGAFLPTKPYTFAASIPPITKARIYTGSAKIDWTLEGLGTLTSITAYNDVKSYYISDADASALPLLHYQLSPKQKDLSQEVIYNSEDFGIFRVTAGVFYYHSVGRYDPLQIEGSLINPTLYGYMRQETNALSGFGEATITPFPRVTIIAGLRYSHEERIANGGYFIAPGRPDTLPKLGLGKSTFNKLTPRASIRYTLPSDDNIYFTYSQGFKSGGFAISSVSPTPFKPERLDAYEIGAKTSTRRAISANISAFLYNYRDQQVLSAVNNLSVTANAASSRIYGADADITVRPSENFSVTSGISYLHARFRQFPDAIFVVPTQVNGVPCGCGNDTVIGDLSGGIEPYSPEITIAVTPEYHREFSAGKFDLSVSLYSTSRFFYDNAARIEQPAYATVAARTSFKPADLPVTFYAWGKNLTGTRYFSTTNFNNSVDDFLYASPRTFGIGARFDL